MGTRSPFSTDDTGRRTALKKRAAAARSHAAATKAWSASATTAAAGTTWRVTSAWIQQSDGMLCAELTHVGSGKVRMIRLSAGEGVDACRARILAD